MYYKYIYIYIYIDLLNLINYANIAIEKKRFDIFNLSLTNNHMPL